MTLPLVAPAGTVFEIKVLDVTEKFALTTPTLTLVAPVRWFPRIFTAALPAPKEQDREMWH